MWDISRAGYLDSASQLDVVRHYKYVSYDLLHIQPHHYVLEIGCGTGADVDAIASAFQTHTIGVDLSFSLLAEAARRSQKGAFCQADGAHLPFPDQSFHACRADRVLHGVPVPQLLLKEMVRITKPQGWVVIGEPDWGTLTIDAPQTRATQKVLQTLTASVPGSRWIGRQLFRLFKSHGLQHVQVSAFTGILTDFEQADFFFHIGEIVTVGYQQGCFSLLEGIAWLEGLKQASRTGQFFCSLTGFVVAGQIV